MSEKNTRRDFIKKWGPKIGLGAAAIVALTEVKPAEAAWTCNCGGQTFTNHLQCAQYNGVNTGAARWQYASRWKTGTGLPCGSSCLIWGPWHDDYVVCPPGR